MMETELLIVGQGICGTFLAWWLEKAGIPFVMIDEFRPFTASRAAAGLINPVTGRRIVKTWMIEELLPFARGAYRQMGAASGISCIKPVTLVDFFPTAQMRVAFLQRYEEDPQYLQLPQDEHDLDPLFHYDLGYGRIGPCYLVDMPGLLSAARKKMLQQGILLQERFGAEALIEEEAGVRYKDIRARRIVFCDGIESCASPYFSRLPFAPNKGEGLIVEIPGLINRGTPGVFKKGISLVPWQDDLYWVGSSYEWSFSTDAPTETFRQRTEAMLKDWLKIPFKVADHFASVRPATLERRPFVGFHPLHPAVGILNGMGAKGCSLAPYFAHQLVQHITGGSLIQPDADVKRFSKILSRE